MIYIAREECKGCGLCIEFCPADVLEISRELNGRGVYPPEVVDAERCSGCENCMIYCPDFAVVVSEDGE